MIRNFLYLDFQKLRSISSQLFEGVADYVLHRQDERTEVTEQQKGSVASGRILGDIFAKEKSSSEMRFLEDHAYSIFEQRLAELDLIEDSTLPGFSVSTQKSFFKVTNNLQINDIADTIRLLENFNTFGEALVRAMSMSPVGKASGATSMSESDIKKLATSQGLQLDEKFIKSLRTIITFGMSEILEASVVSADHLFTSPLKREFLRESAEMILYKFSRVTQQKFTLLGTVTQRGGVIEAADQLPDVSEAEGVKMAMRTLSLHMRTVEQTFLGPLSNELVIDPIAIYTAI